MESYAGVLFVLKTLFFSKKYKNRRFAMQKAVIFAERAK